MRPRFLLALLLFVPLALPGSSWAQITIERGEFEPVSGAVATVNAQAIQAQTPQIQDVLDQIAPGGTFDFSNIQLRGTLIEREIQVAPFDDSVPDDPDFSDADYVNISGGFGFGFPTYSFFRFEEAPGGAPNGLHEIGSLNPLSTSKTLNVPSLLTFGLPLTYPNSWTSGEVTQESYLGGALQNSISVTYSGEVIAHGTLIFPGGERVPALVLMFEQVEEGETIRVLSFVTKGQASITVLTDENRNVIEIPGGTGGSMVPAFNVNLESDAGSVAEIGAGETGMFLGGDLGMSIEVTTGSTEPFTLRGYRVDFPSFNNVIDDSGMPAGFPVENVSPTVWTGLEAATGFTLGSAQESLNLTYRVCLAYGDLPGIDNVQELAVLKRDNSGEPWQPQASTVDVELQQVCADGLSSLSEFAVGGGSSNPLPVELAGFDAQLDGDVVRLTWETASETSNAGFEVERSRNGLDFTPVGFVPGHNTSTEARAYRFDDTQLPFAADQLTYRLRQVDRDGSAQIAGTVEVALDRPDRVALFAPFPNPARDQMTLRYALPTATEVEISVYNVLGQRVATLLDRQQPAGRAELAVDATRWATGTYFVRMIAGPQVRTRQMTVVQ